MSILIFDVVEFRAAYPAFTDTTLYPDSLLQQYWDTATCYISDENYGAMKDGCRRLALNLMTAHLTYLSNLIAQGKAGTITQSATIDKVTVTLTPPPINQGDQFAWWLNTSVYGAQLLSLLSVKSAGGFYIGGSLTRYAFTASRGGLW